MICFMCMFAPVPSTRLSIESARAEKNGGRKKRKLKGKKKKELRRDSQILQPASHGSRPHQYQRLELSEWWGVGCCGRHGSICSRQTKSRFGDARCGRRRGPRLRNTTRLARAQARLQQPTAGGRTHYPSPSTGPFDMSGALHVIPPAENRDPTRWPVPPCANRFGFRLRPIRKWGRRPKPYPTWR